MKDLIYLDYASTTPLHPQVREAMLPYLEERFGNPSATYGLARQASEAIEAARDSVASLLGCRSTEVSFTSGGTESINTAIKGVAFAQQLARMGNHIITSAIEHHAVLHSCQYLEKFGFEITYLPVDSDGMVDPADAAGAVNERTVLVSVMTANNEIGVVEPVAEIAQAVRERARQIDRRIPFHTDAVQAANALSLNVDELGIDLLSLSSHKFYGPKGSGVLYLRRGTPFLPQQSGGGQERQRRAGTENVAAIVGTARALELAQQNRAAYSEACCQLRDRLLDGILTRFPDATCNGCRERRLPNNVNVSFPGTDARDMLRRLDEAGIAASAGSACNEETLEPSHVLLAMDVPLQRAVGTLRLTVSPHTTEAEIDRLLALLPEVVEGARTPEGVAAS
ncbi:MAG: cysteine desulfurase [Chloroflexi bacterium]|nr:cysteine desulfurase [Chloroflexota bacterium]MCH8900834.1 cysteine desulfurase [Chloroflexota bacterium]